MPSLAGVIKAGVAAAILLSFTGGVQADAKVDVVFSKYLEKRMASISRADKRREEVFRDFRRDGGRQAQRPRDRLNNSRFFQTNWANEVLIPDMDDYTVPTLISEMMRRGVDEAAADFEGRVVLEVKELRVTDFPVAAINSFNTRMSGKVKMYSAAGELLAEHKVWTVLVPQFAATRNYQGDGYAYRSTAGNSRVGPIAAEYTAKALKKLFPDYDAPGAVFLSADEF